MSLLTTSSQTVGPYVRIGFEPFAVVDLAPPGVTGERITLSGRVTDGDGKPVNDAVIEIWQANARGKYAHPEDAQDKPVDAGFRGFGINNPLGIASGLGQAGCDNTTNFNGAPCTSLSKSTCPVAAASAICAAAPAS